jgi:hypothetical protein
LLGYWCPEGMRKDQERLSFVRVSDEGWLVVILQFHGMIGSSLTRSIERSYLEDFRSGNNRGAIVTKHKVDN